MKTRIFAALAASAALALASCSENESQEKTEHNVPSNLVDTTLVDASHDELLQAIAERDQLLELINQTIEDMNDLRAVEKIVSVSLSNGEMPESQATTLANNITAIRMALQERSNRIAELEKQLRESKGSNDQLIATLEGLRAQIAAQEAQINELTAQLAEANERIAALDRDLAEAYQQTQIAQEEALRQEAIANECFYCIGSKQELKDHDIIEGGGFLRKSRIMQGDFDKSFFTQADKRSLTEIPLHSKKAKVLTSYQPQGSYEIVEVNGQKVLRITSPTDFWSVSNYLVVQID